MFVLRNTSRAFSYSQILNAYPQILNARILSKKTPGILTHVVKCSPDLSNRFAFDYLRDNVIERDLQSISLKVNHV